MGTRNLVEVKVNGKTKIAQYGQWDGYPKGQGATIAEFLQNVDIEKFKKKVEKLGVWTQEEINKTLLEVGADPNDEFISCDKANKRDNKYPELSRDTGAGILQMVYKGLAQKVVLAENFKNDTLWCEYWYLIDLDNQTVSKNGGKKYPFKSWTIDLMKRLK